MPVGPQPQLVQLPHCRGSALDTAPGLLPHLYWLPCWPLLPLAPNFFCLSYILSPLQSARLGTAPSFLLRDGLRVTAPAGVINGSDAGPYHLSPFLARATAFRGPGTSLPATLPSVFSLLKPCGKTVSVATEPRMFPGTRNWVNCRGHVGSVCPRTHRFCVLYPILQSNSN